MSARPNPSARGMAAFTLMLLTGCASVPDLGAQPQLASPSSFASNQTLSAPVADWPSDHWWQAYGDQQLNALIEEALADSPSLAAAAARVRKAEASLQQAGSLKSPQVYGNSSVKGSYQNLSADGLPPAIADALPNDWRTQAS
ncbi:MAG TPA: TolC family protein, partial [Hyphomonadaceae bacterium]|nr:TolC family protein [Hyphomonadaceae bacterium]